MKSLILILLLSTIYSDPVMYNASDFIEKLRNKKIPDETILLNAINNTIEFLKHYLFYTISSDPPQPDFNKSYFPKKDILNMFNHIKTNDTNIFDFKNDFFSAVYSLNDLHTQPYFGLAPIGYYAYICPIFLTAKFDKEDNKVKMYGDFSIQRNYYSYFKNSEHIVEVIENNLNTSISSINGKDPFEFIQEFTDINMRNKHSTYVFKQGLYTKNNFNIPVRTEELLNFTVIYTNGDNFTTEYIIYDTINRTNDNIFYENEEDNEKFISYLSNHNNKLNSLSSKEKEKPDLLFDTLQFKSFDDIILEFEGKYNVKSNNIFLTPKKIKNKNDNIDWTYTYYNMDDKTLAVFQCRVDEVNKVNVMRINNFGGVSDSEPSLELAKQCAYLFDENDYRIVIIFPRNGGGNPIIGYNIIELLSPYILTRNALRIRKDINIDKFIEFYNSNDLFDELNSTNKVTADYIKDGFVTEKYGDKTDEFSKPFAWRVNQKKIEEIKAKLKHKRIPTDIVIMTDGFALSAASIFMKNAYKSGAGIIIGYNGNPNLPEDIYDISQSPSAVLGVGNYKDIYPELYNNTVKYLIGLSSLTCIASYHEFQESHIPQEYDVQFPDKRIKIYNSYEDIYYQDFINEAIEVLNSYQENCNPKHEMLVKFSDKCKFDNHLHGGYKCGSDSKWNESDCIPVYCDVGYYYNKISNSCIVYPMKKDDNGDKGIETWVTIVIVIGSIVILAIIIILILLIFNKKKILCFKDKNDNGNMIEDLMQS